MTKYEIIQTCFIGGVIRNPGDVIETEEKLSKAVATPVGKAAPAKAEKPAGNEELTVAQLQDKLKAADVEVPGDAKKADLVKLADDLDAATALTN